MHAFHHFNNSSTLGVTGKLIQLIVKVTRFLNLIKYPDDHHI